MFKVLPCLIAAVLVIAAPVVGDPPPPSECPCTLSLQHASCPKKIEPGKPLQLVMTFHVKTSKDTDVCPPVIVAGVIVIRNASGVIVGNPIQVQKQATAIENKGGKLKTDQVAVVEVPGEALNDATSEWSVEFLLTAHLDDPSCPPVAINCTVPKPK